MKKILPFLILSHLGLQADLVKISPTENGAPATEKSASLPPLPGNRGLATYMVLTPQERASDYQQAYELLRKEKTTGKVFFQLTDGSTISNIIDMTLLGNSTLILFRYNTMQGIKLQLVKIEEIASLSYL